MPSLSSLPSVWAVDDLGRHYGIARPTTIVTLSLPPRASTSAVTRAATRQHPPRLMGHWPQRIVWAGATDLEAGLVVLDKGLVRV